MYFALGTFSPGESRRSAAVSEASQISRPLLMAVKLTIMTASPAALNETLSVQYQGFNPSSFTPTPLPPPHTHTRMICGGPRRRCSLLIQFSPPSGWACLPKCRDARARAPRARSATEIDDHEWPKRNGRDVLETTVALIYIRI